MSCFAGSQSVIGYPIIGPTGSVDTVKRLNLGTIMGAVDDFAGGGEFIYLQMPLSQALKVGAVLAYDVATPFLASLVGNTTLLGKAVAMAVNVCASSATPQYGWAQIAGRCPIWSNASIAADTGLGIVAAGQAGAVAAGKSLLGARITLPATTTVVKPAIAPIASSVLQVNSADGWFAGVALSGTGIAGGTLVVSIDRDNRTVLISANTTAAINGGNVTGTYNDSTNFFNIGVLDRPHFQGPIT